MSAGAKVDVLAVLDDATGDLHYIDPRMRTVSPERLAAARADVAELIEAARALYVVTAGLRRDIDKTERAALSAALARVQGGKP